MHNFSPSGASTRMHKGQDTGKRGVVNIHICIKKIFKGTGGPVHCLKYSLIFQGVNNHNLNKIGYTNKNQFSLSKSLWIQTFVENRNNTLRLEYRVLKVFLQDPGEPGWRGHPDNGQRVHVRLPPGRKDGGHHEVPGTAWQIGGQQKGRKKKKTENMV